MELVRKLQDPNLVAKFQKYFGVELVHKKPVPSSSRNCGTTRLPPENYGSTHTLKHSRQGSNVSTASDGNPAFGWASAIFNDEMVGSSSVESEDDKASESESQKLDYVITNQFWYFLFYLATKVGDEIFYIVFFPFWAWNIDGAVLRRVIVIWMITMYIGQALKDILRIPRPKSPPVVRLDPKWNLEYGLPSTHAMVGFSMPFSVVALSLARYQLNWHLCFGIAVLWCLLVCMSRLYLGMHSILDILCGLCLIAGLMGIIFPLIDTLDHLALTHPFSPLISLMLTVALVACYPATDRWTPARGDTTVIVGVGCGALVGSWLNYQLGIIREPSLLPPYTIIWPSLNMVGLTILRTTLGMVLLFAVRAVFKTLSMAIICAILQVSREDYQRKGSLISRRQKVVVELFYKFITYVAIGFTVVFTGPLAFRIIGIERPTFYTEV